MRVARVHVQPPLVQGSKVTLPDSVAYHLTKVLRMRAGALVIVFDGIGNEHYAEILALDSKQVTIRIEEAIRGETESPLQITLVQGVSRAERMDWTLQKATELGVHAIAPVITSRSVVRLDDLRAPEDVPLLLQSLAQQSGKGNVESRYRTKNGKSLRVSLRYRDLILIQHPEEIAACFVVFTKFEAA